MAQNLYNNSYATRDYSQLLAEGDGARAIGIAVAAGQNDLPRGAILKRDTDNTYVHAKATDVVAGSYVAVLDVPLSTGSSTGETALAASAYVSGVFLADKLILKDSDPITAAVEAVLRTQGIMLSAYINAEGEASNEITES